MKNFLSRSLRFFACITILTCTHFAHVFAQQAKPAALPKREISGIVKDSTDNALPGVTIRLTSDKDTLITVTNPDGIFVFKNVNRATYTMSFTMLGFAQQVNKYKQNDAIPRVIMDPIILKNSANKLNEVVINGTPSITYKTDTVEYRASDYIVRENANVDDLLKKMEGMEVGTDGTLMHQGTAVTKAKLNGKTYAGGAISTAIKNLPAAIVDKIQVVDDFGDLAAITGVKEGDPEKVLNIVTRTDKSVGKTANVSAAGGSNNRYDAGVFATSLNGNSNLTTELKLANTLNGIAPNTAGDSGPSAAGGGRGGRGASTTSGGGGSGGTTNSKGAAFSFREQITAKIDVNINYKFDATNVNSLNSSVSELYSTNGTIYTTNESSSQNERNQHNINAEIIFRRPKGSIQIRPSLSYASANNTGISAVGKSGSLISQFQNGLNAGRNRTPIFGLNASVINMLGKNAKKMLTANLDVNVNNQNANQERSTKFYQTDINVLDSLVHRLIERKNQNASANANVRYSSPLSKVSSLSVSATLRHNSYNNKALTSDIDLAGNQQQVDELSNIYNYTFSQAQLTAEYRFNPAARKGFSFTSGITTIAGRLSGEKQSLGTATNRYNFNLIPVAQATYKWSNQHSINIRYTGRAQEPTFDQIQPVKDVSNPQNTIVGNPDLDVAFIHTVTANYNNYIANQKLNYSIGGSATKRDNAIVSNVVQIFNTNNQLLRNETYFNNVDGNYNLSGNYSISKQLANRKYNLSLRGNATYSHGISMSNNVQSVTSIWNFSQRFGPRINPNNWLEVNPSVSHNLTKSSNTISNYRVNTQTFALNIDGRFLTNGGLIFAYSASKNYVSGLNANITSNPLVINAAVEKEFWKRRASLAFQAFDILKQNNFIRLDVTDLSRTETRTNALSRYFMLKGTLKMQKWAGPRAGNNRMNRRKGDGSFY